MAGKTKTIIPNFSNISEQVVSSAESMANTLNKSVIGTKKFGDRMTIIKNNSEIFESAALSVLGVVTSVSENLNIKTFIKVRKGMFLLGHMDFDPLIKFTKSFYGLTKGINAVKKEGDPKKTQETATDIFKAIQSITDPKNVMKMAIGTKMLKLVKWTNLEEALISILAITDDIKGDINQKKKQTDALLAIVINYQKLIGAAMLLSLMAIPGVVIIPLGMKAVKFVVNSILGTVSQIGKLNKEEEKKIKDARNLILSIGATIALFTLTLLVVGQAAASPALILSMVAIGVMIGTTLLMLRIIASKQIEKFTKEGMLTILAIGATFALFALTILIVGEASGSKEMWSAMGALVCLIGAAVGLLFLLGSKFTQNITKEGGLTLLCIAGAFMLFALTVKIISEIVLGGDSWEAFGVLAAVVGISVGVLALLNLMKGQIIQGAIAMAIMGGALLIFTAVIAILNSIDLTWNLLGSFLALAAIIAVCCTALTGLAAVSTFVIPGAAALAITGGALILFAVAIKMVSKVPWDEALISMGMLGGTIAIAATVISKLALKSVSLIPGAAALSLVGVALILFAKAISIISKTATENNISLVKAFVGDKENESGLVGIVNTFKTLLTKDDIKSIRTTARGVNMISRSLKNIAESMKEVSEIKVDIPKLTTNTTTLVKALIDVFKLIATDPEIQSLFKDTGKGFKALFNSPESIVFRTINITKYISSALAELASGVRDMAELKVREYDANGKVKSTRQLTDADFTNAGINVIKIITAFTSELNAHKDDEGMKDILSGKLKKTNAWKAISAAKEIGDSLGSLAASIAVFGTGKFIDKEGNEHNVDFDAVNTNISKLLTSTIGNVNGVEVDTNKNDYLRDTAKTMDNLTEAVNKVDITKLEKINTLMSTLQSFTKGVNVSFDNLATVINGNLVDVLEELKKVLEDTQKAFEKPIEVNSDTTSTPVAMNGKPVEGDKDQATNLASIRAAIDKINTSIQNITRPGSTSVVRVNIDNTQDIANLIR